MAETNERIALELASELRKHGVSATFPAEIGWDDFRLIRGAPVADAYVLARSGAAAGVAALYRAFEAHKDLTKALALAEDAARFEAFKVRHLRGLYDEQQARVAANTAKVVEYQKAFAASQMSEAVSGVPAEELCSGCVRQVHACTCDKGARRNAVAVGDAG